MEEFLAGASTALSVAIALFFLRFWRQTADRLFAIFALAFAVFAVNRLLLTVLDDESEGEVWVYVGRLIVFLLIIAAIVDKNRAAPDEPEHERAVQQPPS